MNIKKITQQQAQKLYPIYSAAWWERARWAGNGPKFQKIGRRVFYDIDELERYFNSSPMVQSTSEYKDASNES